jgi:hypothetical protein
MDAIGGIAALVGALTGLIVLISSLTRTARLRRREQLYREALGTLRGRDAVSTARARAVIEELHRATLAELVARQLTPARSLIWPWLLGLVIIGSFVSVGYSAAGYVQKGRWTGYQDFTLKVFGDSASPILMLAFLVGIVPFALQRFMYTLFDRATSARVFFDEGGPVQGPHTVRDMERTDMLDRLGAATGIDPVYEKSAGLRADATPRNVGLAVLGFLGIITPGFFLASFGALVGQNIWVRRHSGSAEASRMAALESQQPLLGWLILATVLLGTTALYGLTHTWGELQTPQLPDRFPVFVNGLRPTQPRPIAERASRAKGRLTGRGAETNEPTHQRRGPRR